MMIEGNFQQSDWKGSRETSKEKKKWVKEVIEQGGRGKEEPWGHSPLRNNSLWAAWHSHEQIYAPQQSVDREEVPNHRSRSSPQSNRDHCAVVDRTVPRATPRGTPLSPERGREILEAHLPQCVCATKASCTTDVKPGSSRVNRRVFHIVPTQEASQSWGKELMSKEELGRAYSFNSSCWLAPLLAKEGASKTT